MSELHIDGSEHALHEAGPSTAEELGRHPTLRERNEYDLLSFNPMPNYIEVWHTMDDDPKIVVERWLDANQDRLERYGINARQLTAQMPKPYSSAFSRVRDEKEDSYGYLTDARTRETNTEQTERTCPKCGTAGLKNLPNHLRGCDG